MLRESGLSQLKIPKPVCDMQNRNVGLRTRAPRGMHPASQLGSPVKCSCKKSSRYLQTVPHLQFDHKYVSRWYAGRIRQGYRPHPRPWQALAQLVGVFGA